MAILKLILVCYSKQPGKQRVNLMLIIIEFHFENIQYFFSWDEMTTEPCCICVIFVTVDCVSVYIIYIYLYVHICGIVPGKIPFHLELMFYLIPLPLDKMAAISQTIFWDAFSWMKIFEFRLRFHWSLFLMFELAIFHHWIR